MPFPDAWPDPDDLWFGWGAPWPDPNQPGEWQDPDHRTNWRCAVCHTTIYGIETMPILRCPNEAAHGISMN